MTVDRRIPSVDVNDVGFAETQQKRSERRVLQLVASVFLRNETVNQPSRHVHTRITDAIIYGDQIKGMPYQNALFLANLESLKDRRMKLSFQENIFH